MLLWLQDRHPRRRNERRCRNLKDGHDERTWTEMADMSKISDNPKRSQARSRSNTSPSRDSVSGEHSSKTVAATIGNRQLLSLLQSAATAAHRRAVSKAQGDRYEQEADRAAEAAMSEPPSSVPNASFDSAAKRGGAATPSASAGGQPLDTGTREFFERRFGTHLGHVRVHTDSAADLSAKSMMAKAYTFGQDIHFRKGEYQTATREGKSLLAHELAHVVQQSPQRAGERSHGLSQSISRLPAPRIQPRLVATGDTAGFITLINSYMPVYQRVAVSGSGVVTLVSNPNQGPPDREQQALLSALNRIISDSNTTTVQFIHGETSSDADDQRVMIGSYQLSRIDLDDLGRLGQGEGISSASALAHELIEQYRRQVFGEDYPTAHAAGMAEEAAVTGATRGASTRTNIDANTYEIEVAYHYPDRTVYVTRVVRNQNIVSVRRRTTRP